MGEEDDVIFFAEQWIMATEKLAYQIVTDHSLPVQILPAPVGQDELHESA